MVVAWARLVPPAKPTRVRPATRFRSSLSAKPSANRTVLTQRPKHSASACPSHPLNNLQKDSHSNSPIPLLTSLYHKQFAQRSTPSNRKPPHPRASSIPVPNHLNRLHDSTESQSRHDVKDTSYEESLSTSKLRISIAPYVTQEIGRQPLLVVGVVTENPAPEALARAVQKNLLDTPSRSHSKATQSSAQSLHHSLTPTHNGQRNGRPAHRAKTKIHVARSPAKLLAPDNDSLRRHDSRHILLLLHRAKSIPSARALVRSSSIPLFPLPSFLPSLPPSPLKQTTQANQNPYHHTGYFPTP